MVKELKKVFTYIKKEMLVAICIYMIGIILGIVMFYDKKIAMNPQELGFAEILTNNLKVALIVLVSGLLTCGIGSSIIMIFNGATLSGSIMVAINMDATKSIFTAVLPHLFFEIMAYLLILSISFETSKLLLNSIKKDKIRMIYLKKDTIIFGLAICLLIVAAIIEGNVSKF